MSKSGFGMRAPEGKEWAPHIGLRQRHRNLERAWKRWEKLCAESPRAQAVREALLDEVCEEDQAELVASSLVLAGLIAAESARGKGLKVPLTTMWETAVEALLDTHAKAKRARMEVKEETE